MGRVVAPAVFAFAAALSARALACGASAGGAAGVSACSLKEHLESVRPKWRSGAGFGWTRTAIRFNGDMRVDETRQIAFATVDYRLTPEWTFELALGSIFGGSLRSDPAEFDVRPGLLVAAGASWRVLEADGARPFIALTAQIAFAAASTRIGSDPAAPSASYDALDARLGAVTGWPLWQTVTPYVLARAFGGPVYWQYQGATLTGGDVHHFQVGGGLLLRIGQQFDVFAEGVPLGEQGVSAGAGVTF